MNTSYTYANRFVESPDRVFGLMRFHSNASWVDNRTALATTEHLYDFAGNVMDSIAVDKLGGGADSYRNWFSECVSGCDSVSTLSMYRVDEGEMTRQRDKVVFTAGNLDGPASGTRMLIYRLSGAPPKLPGTPLPRHRRERQVHEPDLVARRQVARLGGQEGHLGRTGRERLRRDLPAHPKAAHPWRLEPRLGPGEALRIRRN